MAPAGRDRHQGLRLPLALLLLFAVLGQATPQYPPPYPRPGTTQLFENEVIAVWGVAWPKRKYPLHTHRYDLIGVSYVEGDRVITQGDAPGRLTDCEPGQSLLRAVRAAHGGVVSRRHGLVPRVRVGPQLHDPRVADLFRQQRHVQGDGDLRRAAGGEGLHHGVREAGIGVEINEEGMRRYATPGVPFFG